MSNVKSRSARKLHTVIEEEREHQQKYVDVIVEVIANILAAEETADKSIPYCETEILQ